MIVIGIDIGVTGALCAVDSAGTAAIADLPTTEIDGQRVVRRKVSVTGLRDLIRNFVPPGEAAMALIEDVHMGMGKGAAARSSLDLNRGRVEAVLELLRLDVKVVQPPTWKRHFGLLRTEKAESLHRARGLYPQVAHMLKRQKDHNRAEAILLAHYGRTVLA